MPRRLRPDRKIGVITDGDDLYLEYVDRLPCLPTWLPILEPRQSGRLFFLEHDLRARKIPPVTSLRLHWRYVHWRDRIPHFECRLRATGFAAVALDRGRRILRGANSGDQTSSSATGSSSLSISRVQRLGIIPPALLTRADEVIITANRPLLG